MPRQAASRRRRGDGRRRQRRRRPSSSPPSAPPTQPVAAAVRAHTYRHQALLAGRQARRGLRPHLGGAQKASNFGPQLSAPTTRRGCLSPLNRKRAASACVRAFVRAAAAGLRVLAGQWFRTRRTDSLFSGAFARTLLAAHTHAPQSRSASTARSPSLCGPRQPRSQQLRGRAGCRAPPAASAAAAPAPLPALPVGAADCWELPPSSQAVALPSAGLRGGATMVRSLSCSPPRRPCLICRQQGCTVNGAQCLRV